MGVCVSVLCAYMCVRVCSVCAARARVYVHTRVCVVCTRVVVRVVCDVRVLCVWYLCACAVCVLCVGVRACVSGYSVVPYVYWVLCVIRLQPPQEGGLVPTSRPVWRMT